MRFLGAYVNSLNRKKINEMLEKWAAQGTLLEVVTVRDTCLCLGAGVLPPATVKWVSCFTRYLGFLLYRFRAKLKGEWISQLWYIHTLKHYSGLKRNNLPSAENMWGRRQCIL